MNKNSKQFSLELQILIEAIKLTLLNAPPDIFKELVNLPTVDWDKIHKLQEYHRIRPLFYEACRLVAFQNDTVTRYKNLARRQILNNIASGGELGRLLTCYSENNIQCIPYKGVLFIDKLYGNRMLRESGDIDILVKPSEALKALKLLIEDGYVFDSTFYEITETHDELLIELIERSQLQELSLSKELASGIRVNIDFHWAIGETFHLYNLEVDELLEESRIETFQRKQLLIPNTKTIFKMLLNHHGGRGCWLTLKHFTDLIAFRNQYPDDYFNNGNAWAKEAKMGKVFEMGDAIVETVFLESEKYAGYEPKIQKQIFNYWEDVKSYDLFSSKLSHRNIYRKLQDEHLSWLGMAHQFLKYYSIPNKIERERLLVFPDRYVYLNAFAKFVSYLWYRVRLKNR